MSCISSNFSSFFLDSLNDPSEFAKYLSNGENNKFSSPFEEFQVFSSAGVTGYSSNNGQQHHHHQQQQQQYSLQQQQNFNGSNGYYNNNLQVNSNGSNNSGVIGTAVAGVSSAGGQNHNNANQQHAHPPTSQQQQQQQYVGHLPTSSFQQSNHQLPLPTHHPHAQQHPHPHQPTHHQTANPVQGYASPIQRWSCTNTHQTGTTTAAAANQLASTAGAHFDGSFEFLKYLRHSNDYSNGTSSSSNSADDVAATTTATGTQSAPSAASLIDLDTSTSMKPRSARKAAALLSSATRAVAALDNTLDVFDHDDSKHTIFDLQHNIANNSNSNEESSMDISNLAFPHSLLNASNSNTSSESAVGGNADFTNLTNAASASNAPKPLATFTIKENFEVHPSHKVEEGIFQHMNKLPPKKKETLKQLGVRFTGQMTLADKSIVVDNFIKFCQEYEITDHRPYLSLNQSGLNKPEQIKFARYLGQGLPSFTLFCIYSNFKNLFCTKRIENYTKDGYNLPYILDKTKRFLSNTTADLKNISQQQSNDGLEFSFSNNNNNNNNHQNQSIVHVELMKNYSPKILENFLIYENFEVHDTHRIEDGICTHITRLPPKKQEILKQFGIQSNQSVTYYEKYIIVENFIKFCNEYKISDHRPFLDFQESGLSKAEQIKFVRYLGQGLPNLTLNKIFVAFRDVFGMSRIEKITIEGYNLDAILKKKKKNLYNRMHAAVHLRENVETTTFPQFPQHDADDPFDLTKSKS